MLALTDSGLGYIAIAASAIPHGERRRWLKQLAAESRRDPGQAVSRRAHAAMPSAFALRRRSRQIQTASVGDSRPQTRSRTSVPRCSRRGRPDHALVSTRTARRPTATRRRARMRWPRSPRARGGNEMDRENSMRAMALVLLSIAIMALLLTDADAKRRSSAQGSQAAGASRSWCATYGRKGINDNCSYSSFDQCWATVLGRGGFCRPNPFPGTAYGTGYTWGSGPMR